MERKDEPLECVGGRLGEVVGTLRLRAQIQDHFIGSFALEALEFSIHEGVAAVTVFCALNAPATMTGTVMAVIGASRLGI